MGFGCGQLLALLGFTGLCCTVTLLLGIEAKVQGWSVIGKRGMVFLGRQVFRFANCSAKVGNLSQSELVWTKATPQDTQQGSLGLGQLEVTWSLCMLHSTRH